MNPKDDIERLVRSVRATTSAAVDEQILSDAAEALARAVQRRSAIRPTLFKTGLETMKRHWRPAAAAIAAAVMIAVMLIVFQNGASPAYAFEQTVRASHGVRTIHFRLEYLGEQENPIDVWARFGEDGQLLQCRTNSVIPEGHKQAVWQDNKAEMLLVEKQYYAVQKDQSIANRMRDFINESDPKNIVMQLQELQMSGRVQLDVQEGAGNAAAILVTATFNSGPPLNGRHVFLDADPDRIVLEVSAQSKLVSLLTMYKRAEGEYRRLGEIRFLEYNQPIDPAMFTLQVPDAGVTFDQWSQEVGLSQGAMSDEEAAAHVVRQFFEAVIAGDYVAAGRLYQGIRPDMLKQQYEGGKIIRIVSVDEPVPEPKVQGFRVAFVLEIQNDGGVEQFRCNAYVQRVHLHPDRWTICGGI